MFEFFVCKAHPQRQKEQWVGLKYLDKACVDKPSDNSLASFCFPLRSEAHTTKRLAAPEEYCFVLTGSMGDRSHGFCRRVYVGDYPKKLPVVFCIVTCELWSLFFYKILEVLENLVGQEKLLGLHLLEEIPSHSAAAQFLKVVESQLKSDQLMAGSVLTIPLPHVPEPIFIDPLQKITSLSVTCPDLKITSDAIDLQVPPFTGGSSSMRAVSLARLLWRLPVQCSMTLIASLFLERRIIMVSKSKDTLSASVHAAAALIYPFEWHHRFYLPIMPETMRDYLQAPMPFLIGLPAELLDFKGLQMDEVTLIDLDLGTCSPKPGSEMDDAKFLPSRRALQDSLHAAVKSLRSPTEFEGNQVIASCMVDYAIRLFKTYKNFMIREKDGVIMKPRGAALSTIKSKQVPEQVKNPDDAYICGHGFIFDHENFVASHKKEKDRIFLNMFRGSQMYEMFIQQRMEMASKPMSPMDDPFELRIRLIEEHTKPHMHKMYRTWSRKHSSRLSTSPIAARLKHCRSQISPLAGFQVEKARSLELKARRKSNVQEQSTSEAPKAHEKVEEIIKSIGSIVQEMAEESKKQDVVSAEPGNYLRMSRASFREKGLEKIPNYEINPNSPSSSSRRTLDYQDPSIEPLILLDVANVEKTDEFGDFPLYSKSDFTMSMPSSDLDALAIETTRKIKLQQESQNEVDTKRDSQVSKKASFVHSASAFKFSHDEFSEKFKLEESLPAESNGQNSMRNIGHEREKNSKKIPENKESKMEKMINRSLKGLSNMTSHKLGLPPKPGKNSAKEKHSSQLERSLAFSIGSRDEDNQD